MNILLIQPNFLKNERGYPLGLAYLGAVLKLRGHRVFGSDLAFRTHKELSPFVSEIGIDLIGISLMSYSFPNALSFVRQIKTIKSIPIVCGGPHATIFKEKILHAHHGCFDYLIVGEGESTILDLVESIEKGISPSHVRNLIYVDHGNILSNECSRKEVEIDRIPFPDRDIFPIFQYKGMFTKSKKYTQLISSRGCNNSCNHCPEPSLWNKWRGRSPENIIEEISSVVDNFGIKEFHFEDSNFFGGGAQRVKILCQLLIEKSIDIIWQCPNGIPIMDLEDISTLEFMARAGCYSIWLGIESFDNELLKSIGRSSDLSFARKIVRVAHRLGLEVRGFFIIGLPKQTRQSIKRDISLSRSLKLDQIEYSIFHLIPGSSLFNRYAGEFPYAHIIEKRVSLSEVKVESLERIRIKSSLFNCLSLRLLLLIWRRLKSSKEPFRIFRKSMLFLCPSRKEIP